MHITKDSRTRFQTHRQRPVSSPVVRMPSEQGTELNLNELVGNLLAETEGIPSLEETHTTDDHDNLKQDGSDNKEINNNDNVDHNNNDIGNDDILPDLLPMSQLPPVEHTSDHDLASMVSQAIHSMNDNADNIHDNGDLEGENDTDLHSKEQEWANILRQGILQADQEMQEHQQAQHEQHNTSEYQESAAQPTDDQVLDQDDENLRLAILDSLQHLEQEKKTKKHSKKDKKSKEKKKSSKKTEKEKDKSKEKGKSKKKEKKSKGKKSATANDSDILNFEDVIKGFMEQTESVQPPAVTQMENNAPMGDAETQALVEATLKAFENQLLGNSASPKPKTTVKKTQKTSSHKFTKSLPPPLPMPFFPITQKRKVKPKSAKKASKEKHDKEPKAEDTSTKKKKASKKKSSPKDDYNEDEFSKALAEMVNQVVNTSLVDSTQPSQAQTTDVSKTAKTSKKKSKQKSKDKKTESSSEKAKSKESKSSSKKESSPKKKQDTKVIPLDPELFKESVPHADTNNESSKDTTDVSNLNNDDTLDLHQIMQNAMSMAFQEQVQNPLPSSVMERFDKELAANQFLEPLSRKSVTDRSVIRSRYVPPKKKKKEKKKGELKFNNIHGGLTSTKFNLSKKHAIGSKIVLFKPQKIKQELENNSPKTEKDRWRKKFSRICKECAKKGKKWSIERRKKLKDEEKSERNRLKLQRKELKEEQKAKRELEKKELEEIVTKGPPYPEDLCLTSSGRPRKPYRRYTPEEMMQRAAMSSEELIAFDRSNDDDIAQEKREQQKNNSVIKLKQLTLFNPNLAYSGQRLNDLKSSIKKVRKSSSGTISSQKKSKRRHASVFDPTAKTVVHREKIPFHPPWQIPVNPPFALPVARRKKHHSLEKMSRRKRALYQRTLISNTLLPILHTLRAAAKATASAGVDPERSREHLRSMLYQARLTIADTLQKARSANKTAETPEEAKENNDKLAEKPNIPIPIMRATLKVKKEESATNIFNSNSDLSEKSTKEIKSDDVQIISESDDTSTTKARKIDEKDSLKIGSKRTLNDAADDSDIRQNVTEVINKLSTLIPSLSKANSLPLMAPPKKKPKSMLNMDEVKIPLNKPKSSSTPNSTSITNSGAPRPIPIVKMEENTNNDSSLLSEDSEGMIPSTTNSDQLKNEDTKVRFKSPAMQVPKKTADLFNKYNFSLPTTNAVGKTVKSIQVMKRVKDYLPAEDITRLKKVKETYRKRKWRLANSDKNKDLELRTRIKMAARKQFGDSDSEEKQKWIAKEYEIRKVKLELDPTTKSNSAVMVTDEEILNIIAVSLDKLDVARTIEHDIQEEVKNNGMLQRKKPSKKPNTKIQTSSNDSVRLPIIPMAQKNTTASSTDIDKSITSASLVAAEHLVEHVSEQVPENRIDPSLAAKRPREDEESETSLNKETLPSPKKACMNI